MEKSNSIIHVGNGFLFFLTSFNPSTLLMSSPLDSNFFSKTGLELLSGDVSDETLSGAACSESCCWLYFSTYSGKIFLNVALHGKLSIQQELVVKNKLRDLAHFHFEWLVQYTYFLQLKEREDFARRCFSAVVVFTLPVVGLLSICKTEDCQISKLTRKHCIHV